MDVPGTALRAVEDEPGSLDAAHPSASGGEAPNLSSPQRVRIIDATLDCLALHGTAKTTVDDIARRAGVSRATVYRVFPGGRDEMLSAVVDTEMARLFSALGVRLGEARDLTEALAGGIVEASARIRGHRALAYLVEHEPEMVLGHLAFDESDRLLATASRFVAPFLSRWMSPPEAGRVAEWATRIVLSYAIAPSPRLDLTRPARARRLVEQFVVPGIRALHVAGAGSTIDISPFGPGPPQPSSSGKEQPHRSKKEGKR
jgi:AcrR family transcriptional regulator